MFGYLVEIDYLCSGDLAGSGGTLSSSGTELFNDRKHTIC